MQDKFIVTKDPSTSELLKKAGFVLVSSNGGEYVFLNNETKNVSFRNKVWGLVYEHWTSTRKMER